MRIAVIGGGLFGCTAAIVASRAGHDVHLHDAKSDLMLGATAGTYSRLHRGYHYPRSPETGRESRGAERSFRAEYGDCVIDKGRQFYMVPAAGSHVTVDQYRDFLDNEGLPFSEEGGVFAVEEPRIDLARLQRTVRAKVCDAGVAVHLGSRITARNASKLRREHDLIVIAAYARGNHVGELFGGRETECKFQVVEKPVVRLPGQFRDTSIVVVDGPFGCVDPMDGTEYHVLGHVVHTIHASNTGRKADIPPHLEPLLDSRMTHTPHTRVKAVIDDLARYIPGIEAADHAGSIFTVRAVLAGQEASDARPTLVERVGEDVVKIFSGKLGTACAAANAALAMVGERTSCAA